MKIISRQEALALGLKKYFTGVPCKRGHIAERYASSSGCTACMDEITSEPGKRAARQAANHAGYVKNKQQRLASSKAYQVEHRSAIAAAGKLYRAGNKEAIAAAEAAWCANNRERKTATSKAWAAANPHPERRRLYNHNRRARKIANGGSLSAGLATRLLALQDGRCACPCGALLVDGYHMDHIVAITKGGSNTDSNIQLLTPRCNQAKHTKDNEVFMQTQREKYRA